MEPIKILHVTPEAAPITKVGGLAEVAGSLPMALKELKLDARIILPAWGDSISRCNSKGYKHKVLPEKISLCIKGVNYSGTIHEYYINGLIFYLIEQDQLFKGEVYNHYEGGEIVPFMFMSYCAIQLPYLADWDLDIFHCHDWTTSFLPLALKWNEKFNKESKMRKTVLTIHNLAHQGIYGEEVIDDMGLSKESFSMEGVEFYGSVNLLKGAIVCSDQITTVSENYSREIMTDRSGEGLDGVLRSKCYKLTGILNGLDYSCWNPLSDNLIPFNYCGKNLEKKDMNKKALMERSGLEGDNRIIAIMVSRLVEQKGLDILIPLIDGMIAKDINLVLVGTGEERYENILLEKEAEHPNRIKFFRGYHDELARLAYSGGDLYLMPSRFEPCGLSQLIALKYGTIPVVHGVGGLLDTIDDFSEDGIGFIFRKYSSEDLMHGIDRAIKVFENKHNWRQLMKKAMRKDFSWRLSAMKYREIYRRLIDI